MYKKLLFLTAFCCLMQIQMQAQEDIDLGVNIGVMNYQGDFAGSPVSFDHTNFAIGGQLRRTVIPQFGVRLGVLFGKISGDYSNAWEPRSWQFERKITEISLMAEWHPWGKSRIADNGSFSNSLSPYIALGTGFVFGDFTLSIPEEDLENFKPEHNIDAFLVLPISVGLRYFITDRLSVATEFGTRYTSTDALDGVSINGNPDANDWYWHGGLSIYYLIRPDKRVAYDYGF